MFPNTLFAPALSCSLAVGPLLGPLLAPLLLGAGCSSITNLVAEGTIRTGVLLYTSFAALKTGEGEKVEEEGDVNEGVNEMSPPSSKELISAGTGCSVGNADGVELTKTASAVVVDVSAADVARAEIAALLVVVNEGCMSLNSLEAT